MEDFTNTPEQTNKPNPQSSPAQNLGIGALITAIITFVMALIPCIGMVAIIPGIIAIVLAAVGMSHASRNNSPRGVLLAAMIVAILASLIAFSQVFVIGKFAEKADKWPREFQNIMQDVQKEVFDELDDANISIKVENRNGEKVEITTTIDKKDREATLDELEKGNAPANDTMDKGNK
jgi:phosphate/sulfate permease